MEMKTVWCRAKSLMRLRAIVFISFFFAAVVGPGGSFAGTKAFFTYSTPKYDRVKMYDMASETESQIFYDSLSDWSVGNLAAGNGKLFFTHSTSKYDRVKMYDIASDTVSQIFYDSLSDWSVGNLAVTPEPSTLGMLALGGLAMLKRRGRRR